MVRTKKMARKSTGDPATQWRSFRESTTVIEDAWAITEIAENILLQLPMKDVLLAQRVCLGWRELIRCSPALQEHLFMRAKPRKNPSDKTIREYNPLLLEHMPMWFSAKLNHTVKDVPWGDSDQRLAFLRRDASWRNMLLAQPPFTVFEVAHTVHAMGGDGLSVGSAEQPDGVRMSQAYDAAVHYMRDGGFYTLLDGKRGHDLPEENMKDDLDERESFFGGIEKFTLITRRSISCTGKPSSVHRRLRLEQQQFTSAEAGAHDFVLTRVEGRRGFAWFSADGYSKRRS